MASSRMRRLVSIPKEDLESLEATIEVLEDENIMRQLNETDKAIKDGKVRDLEDLLNEF